MYNYVNFNNHSSGYYFFSDINDIEIMICSRTDYGNNIPTLFGNYDMMNLVWFKGAEVLYNPTTEQGKFLNTIITFISLKSYLL